MLWSYHLCKTKKRNDHIRLWWHRQRNSHRQKQMKRIFCTSCTAIKSASIFMTEIVLRVRCDTRRHCSPSPASVLCLYFHDPPEISAHAQPVHHYIWPLNFVPLGDCSVLWHGKRHAIPVTPTTVWSYVDSFWTIQFWISEGHVILY